MRHLLYLLILLVIAPGSSFGQKPPRTITTSHLIQLKNNRKIEGTVTKKSEDKVHVAIGDLGTVILKRSMIASIAPRKGAIKLPPPAPRSKQEKEPKQKLKHPSKQHVEGSDAETAGTEEKGMEQAGRFTPPPVPEAKQKELDQWLYDLGRQSGKHRIRAERHLKAMGGFVTAPVIPYTEKKEWLIRCAALRILGHVAHPSGVPAIWRALTDEHETVRKVASQQLTRITGREGPDKRSTSPRSYKKAAAAWKDYLQQQNLLPGAVEKK